MNKKLFDELNGYIDKLISIVASSDAVRLLQTIAVRQSFPGEHALTSPYNQFLYLAGLVLSHSNKKPQHGRDANQLNWKNVEELLEKIFWQYFYIFLPDASVKVNELTKEWFKIREVAMATFLRYYNEPILCRHDQLMERLISLYTPFDDLLQNEVGLSVDCTLKIIDFIQNESQKKYDNFVAVKKEGEKEREAFISKWQEENWSEKEAKEKIRNTKLEEYLVRLLDFPGDIFVVERSDLVRKFGSQVTNGFLNLFACRLVDKHTFRYITDPNPMVYSPLVILDANQMLYLDIRSLYVAVLYQFHDVIKKSTNAESFYEHRSKWVEDKTYEILTDFFTQSDIVRHVFETKDGHNEHDIVLTTEGRVIIIEVKASPPKPPLRDPEKAFIRIRDAFNSKKGIQCAYDQALHLKQYIVKNQNVVLYNQKGDIVAKIEEKDYRNGIDIICVTADNFGSLATDLSLLLRKPEGEKYPYVVNLYDIEILLRGFIKEGKGVTDFLRYLDTRAELHGKVHTFDELDIAGYFLKYNGLDDLITAKEKQILDITFSSIFDKHYFADYGIELSQENKEEHGPYNVEVSRKGNKITLGIKGYPETYSTIDLSAKRSDKSSKNRNSNAKKPGRNEPCPCGSGKKYKKCCGKMQS